MQLAQVLDTLMKKSNISAYKISKDTGISDRLIGYWRKGEKLPGAENLLTIANYFGISVDYLLTGKEKSASMEQLSENEQEMLDVFQKFNDREQIKLIGKLEELYRQKQIKECVALKVSRSPDGEFRRTEISKEELERIDNLPEDNDI